MPIETKSPPPAVEILIVEDSPTQAEQLKYLLEQNSYAVTVAANGRLALEVLKEHQPQLVISDIVMPEMDGYALCQAIKSDKELEDIPVLLVTVLSDVRDVMKGLECGTDNFIRKPYNEKNLLARIEYLLMSRALSKDKKMRMAMEIYFSGQRYLITADRQQILDQLISIYEEAVHMNAELETRRQELAHSNQTLTTLCRMADGLNRAVSEQEVIDKSVECATELLAIRACWIALCEGDSGFRLAGARNLPSELTSHGILEGDCLCRRQLLSGKLDTAINVIDCEFIKRLQKDTGLSGQHISIPIKIVDRPLGVMNLLQAEQRPLSNEELKTLQGIANQIAMALMRARMHEHLDQQVQQRTAALAASESALKEAQHLAGLGRWKWDTRTGEHTWSEDIYRIYGRDPALPPAIYPEVQQYFTPDSWASLATAVEKCLVEGVFYECDAEVVRPDGTHRWIVARGEATRDDTGNIINLHGTVQDITERKRFEDALRLRDRAIEASSVGVIISDAKQPGHPIIYANQAFFRMTGYSREEVIGRNARFLQGPDTDPKAIEEIREALREKRDCHITLKNYRKDGTFFWNELLISPVRDEKEKLTHFIGIQTDVTSLRRAEEERHEMEIARKIQISLLPMAPLQIEGALIAGYCQPAAHVGGDYFDYFCAENIADIVIADVSGHSIGAALIMAETRSTLKVETHQTPQEKADLILGAADILQVLNKHLYEDLIRAELFITMFYMKYHLATRQLFYANAGHNYPLLLRHGEKACKELDAEGLILGVKDDVIFEEKSLFLQKGDMVLLYTDGITEAQNKEGEFFGVARLSDLVVAYRESSPQNVIDIVVKELRNFCQSSSFNDDISMVVLKIT